MKFLRSFFGLIYIIGFGGNSLLFLYTEWIYIRENFIQLLNPFLHIQVIITLLTTPLFWIFLIITLLGFYSMKGTVEDDNY